jgi:membrane protease YdiL (CAAX protease family)
MAPFMPDQQPVDDGPTAEAFSLTTCWRCGLAVPEHVDSCPHCAARLIPTVSGPFALSARPALSTDSFDLLFKTYIILLATGIIHALVLGIAIQPKRGQALDQSDRNRVFTQILVVEAIDTVVIAWALITSWGRFTRPTSPHRTRLAAWIVALPALGALLLLNLGYHALLREIIHRPLVSDQLMNRFDLISFVAICVQPAIVEEVYCRMFALDCLRGALGRHAAVWISATMFAFLHVAVLPSVPYLIVVGAVLAYLRLASGTLLLPILLHFVHNLVILLIECGMN